jgi:hypothetical protein
VAHLLPESPIAADGYPGEAVINSLRAVSAWREVPALPVPEAMSDLARG